MRSAVIRIRALASLLVLCHALPMLGQQSATATNLSVPPLVRFSGVLTDVNGTPLTEVTGVTFCLYKDSQGGAPLWMEIQNVQPNKAGQYSVMLGSTTSQGLPFDLFVSGEARWLGVQPQSQSEQPRVLLLSVPYALKAGDAETVGGLPPSAFVLAAPSGSTAAASNSVGGNPVADSAAVAPPSSSSVTTTGGTVNALSLWTTATNIQSSALTQTGTGATAKIGINTTTPASTLDVKGAGTIRGLLSLPATGTATATAGTNSQPLDLVASAFNSGPAKAQNETFQWQAEPTSNNTSSPSGTLNLLFGSGTNKPAETGLNIASNGLITFASGQTFPGTGTGTITGVTAGSGLLGGGTSGNVTLNLDTTKVPQLNTTNSFTGDQGVTGNVTASGTVSGGLVNTANGVEMGGIPLAFESVTTESVFLGDTNNTTNTGNENTATGFFALGQNTTGSGNTADGWSSLLYNTTGGSNTAVGFQALLANSTGSGNTAVGASSLTGTTTSSYNTAIGDGTLFQNKTGTGNTAGGYQALTSNTTGEYSTASGYYALLSNTTGGFNTAVGSWALWNTSTGSSNTAIGDIALSANTTGSNNVAVGTVAGGASPNSALTTGNQNTYVGAFTSSGTQTNLTNATAIGAYAEVTENNAIVLGSINGINSATSNVNVGIGTTAPAYALDVRGTGNFSGLVTFAPSQTFPGTGTITAVNPGADLLGGGNSGTVTLSVDTSKVVTGLTAGFGLTGGGTGGIPTLSVDPTQVPLLNAANNVFNGNQTINGYQAVNGNLFIQNNATYQPLSVQSSSTFGTWLSLNNTSTGGKQWAILSAGGANAEGAGNIGITNFTGTSSIYLEGNVKANTLSVNNDTPMSHNPHMSFSTTYVGSLCGGWANCGYGTGSQWGGFVPDYNIVITRFAATLNSAIDPSCPADIAVTDITAGQLLGSLTLPGGAKTFDSGPVSIPVTAGHFITVVPAVAGWLCNLSASAGGDVYINTQYVMQ